MRRLFLFLVIAFFGYAAMAETPDESHKIHYLLDQLASSDVIFIRNGEKQTGEWAKDHLQKKWDKAGKPSLTAEQFIDQIASKSNQSGKPYWIKTADGKTVKASQWFKDKLASMPVD